MLKRDRHWCPATISNNHRLSNESFFIDFWVQIFEKSFGKGGGTLVSDISAPLVKMLGTSCSEAHEIWLFLQPLRVTPLYHSRSVLGKRIHKILNFWWQWWVIVSSVEIDSFQMWWSWLPPNQITPWLTHHQDCNVNYLLTHQPCENNSFTLLDPCAYIFLKCMYLQSNNYYKYNIWKYFAFLFIVL